MTLNISNIIYYSRPKCNDFFSYFLVQILIVTCMITILLYTYYILIFINSLNMFKQTIFNF